MTTDELPELTDEELEAAKMDAIDNNETGCSCKDCKCTDEDYCEIYCECWTCK